MYCEVCSESLGFDKPDIHVGELLTSLKNNIGIGCKCDGCNLLAYGKDTKGNHIFLYQAEEVWSNERRNWRGNVNK